MSRRIALFGVAFIMALSDTVHIWFVRAYNWLLFAFCTREDQARVIELLMRKAGASTANVIAALAPPPVAKPTTYVSKPVLISAPDDSKN